MLIEYSYYENDVKKRGGNKNIFYRWLFTPALWLEKVIVQIDSQFFLYHVNTLTD